MQILIGIIPDHFLFVFFVIKKDFATATKNNEAAEKSCNRISVHGSGGNL
jgi:hypothetical protein